MAGTVRKAVAGLGTPNETPARTKLPNSAEDRRFESISLQRGVSELSVPERRTDRRENIVTAAGGMPGSPGLIEAFRQTGTAAVIDR